MTKLESIVKAIAELSTEERGKLRAVFDQLEADLWDTQIERDAKAGKLDKLITDAVSEDEAGQTTDL